MRHHFPQFACRAKHRLQRSVPLFIGIIRTPFAFARQPLSRQLPLAQSTRLIVDAGQRAQRLYDNAL
jgi:hypothetical protein